MNTKITDALNSLKRIFERNYIDFMVGGTVALKVCGVPLDREPHDIDVIVTGKKEDLVILDSLAETYKPSYETQYDKYPNLRTFIVRGIIVNAWIVDKLDDNYVWSNYIQFQTVETVLKHKFGYGRIKDYQDFSNIVSNMAKFLKEK